MMDPDYWYIFHHDGVIHPLLKGHLHKIGAILKDNSHQTYNFTSRNMPGGRIGHDNLLAKEVTPDQSLTILLQCVPTPSKFTIFPYNLQTERETNYD